MTRALSCSFVFFVAVAGGELGCSGDDGAGVQVAVGTLESAGFPPTIAVLHDQAQLLAYVCDGDEWTVNTADWFEGNIDGRGFDLTSASGARLVGQVGSEGVRGTFTDGAGDHAFDASPASGDAAVFAADVRGTDGLVRGGWIVWSSGEQRGAALRVTDIGVATVAPLTDLHDVADARGGIVVGTGVIPTAGVVSVPSIGSPRELPIISAPSR